MNLSKALSFGLSNDLMMKIISIFSNYKNIEKVYIFGSRAMGNYNHNSDIDLVLIGKIEPIIIGKIKLDLEDLDTPYFFDVISYQSISSQELKEHIKKKGKIIFEK